MLEFSILEMPFYFCVQKNGIEKNLGLGKLNDYEVNLIKAALPELDKNIAKGEEFLSKNPCPK